jgi:hypothetical protein
MLDIKILEPAKKGEENGYNPGIRIVYIYIILFVIPF